MSDTDRVEKLFRGSGGRWIKNTEIVAGQYYGSKRILSYTERIANVRVRWSCSCGEDPSTCTASEHLVNVKKNFFQYKNNLRRGVQRPGTVATPAPLPVLPERVAKLEGENLNRWNEIGEWLKTKKQMPVIFEKQVMEGLL